MDNSPNTGAPHNFTPVNQGKLPKKKNKLYLLILALVAFLGIGVGLFLVSNPQVLQPRADWQGSGLYLTNCFPFKEWRESSDPKGQQYRCYPDNLEINFFRAVRGEGILRGFLDYPRGSNNVCFIRHYRCQKRNDETNAQFIKRMQENGCQTNPGYRIYVNRNNPSAPYNQNFREVIESNRRDQNLLAEARFTPSFCGAQQMDISCGDRNLVYNSLIDLRPEVCQNQPSPTPTKKPSPTPTPKPNCPVPPEVTNIKITCPNCK